eukprot:g73803.t1
MSACGGGCSSGGCGSGKEKAGGGCGGGSCGAGKACCQNKAAEAPLDPAQAEAAAKAIAQVKELVNRPGVFIFCKGTAEEPKCKNTRKMLDTFKAHGIVNFTCHDILPYSPKDPGSIRFQATQVATENRGVETLFPQVWVNGQCLGGNEMLDWCVKWNCLDRVLAPALATSSKKGSCCSGTSATNSTGTLIALAMVPLAMIAVGALRRRSS